MKTKFSLFFGVLLGALITFGVTDGISRATAGAVGGKFVCKMASGWDNAAETLNELCDPTKAFSVNWNGGQGICCIKK